MTPIPPMTEDKETRVLANKILDRINGDPDDDLAMLSRQLLRADQRIAKLTAEQEHDSEIIKHYDSEQLQLVNTPQADNK